MVQRVVLLVRIFGRIQNDKKIVVEQKSDFTGEIEHACTCIESGLIESPIMSRNASLEILKVIGV